LALTRKRKEELVAEYADMLGQSRALIFTEYRGLNNTEMTRLRRAVREANGTYRVVKLTLLKRALEDGGYAVPEYLSDTPVAIGFCFDEVPGVAKALTDYAGESDFLMIQGGLMGRDLLSARQIESIANLPPLEVLRAQILGLFDAPAANLVGVVQAGVAQVINVLNAYVEQGEGVPAAATE
jgi:large subunit ribosomal protein L10